LAKLLPLRPLTRQLHSPCSRRPYARCLTLALLDLHYNANMSDLHDRSILVVGLDDSHEQIGKGIWEDVASQARRVTAISTAELAGRLSEFTRDVASLFERVNGAVGSYELETFEISAEITAKGEIRLLGSAGLDVKGGLKLIFRKKGARE